MAKRVKSGVFNLSGISIIACDCLQAVICIFIDLFFVSRILHNEMAAMPDKIVSIALFYIVDYAMIIVFYVLNGFFMKKINKSIFVSIGSILLAGTVLMVHLLQNDLMTFVPLIAAVYGIAWGFFSAGYNSLTAETISSKHQVKFFAVKRIAFQFVYIIFPITLGFIADLSFSYVTYIMFGIAVLLVIFSFLIRPKKSIQMEYNLPKFTKYMYKNRKQTKSLWLVYIQNFFRGASYDCFTTLITILVIFVFQKDSTLGTFRSIFTACSLVAMFVYLKFYRKKRAVAFITPIISLVACSIIAILCAANQVTIIIFYAIYSSLNVVMMSISDSRRAGVVRVLSLHSHILESNTLAEVFLETGRIVGSVVLLLAGVFDSLMGGGTLFLMISLAIVCLFFVLYGVSLIFSKCSLG